MHRALSLAPVALLLQACFPFGSCELERVHVSFAATVTVGDAVQHWDLRGEVSAGNLDRATYDRLADALIEDGVSAAGAVWTLDAGFGAQMGFLAVHLAADPASGDVVTVSGALAGGGWGFLPAPREGALVGARVGAFEATSASGTFTVLATKPLRLSADVTVTDGEGVSYRFVGEMVFDRTVDPVPCD